MAGSCPYLRLHSIYDQPDAASVHAQFDRILDAPTEKLPTVADHLDAARTDICAFTAFPKEIWRQIWSNNPNERLNREIRRRTDVVGIFPDRASISRLVGTVLAEQHDERAEGRRYLGLDVLAKSQALHPTEEMTIEPTPALTADHTDEGSHLVHHATGLDRTLGCLRRDETCSHLAPRTGGGRDSHVTDSFAST